MAVAGIDGRDDDPLGRHDWLQGREEAAYLGELYMRGYAPMSSRLRIILAGVYVLGLCFPWACIAAWSSREIGTWLETGTCPAGPMDRPAAPCGPGDFFVIVFLGGWAAFVVVPFLFAWSTGCTGALAAAVVWLRRGSRTAAALGPMAPDREDPSRSGSRTS